MLFLVASAQAAAWNGTCDVTFRGSSTLHDFAGKAPCQPFQVGAEIGAGGRTIIPGAEVAVLAGDMDTDNEGRDRQMREMLQADKYPRIRGVFGAIDPEGLRQTLRKTPGGKVPLDFTLRIRDIQRPVHAVAGNFRESDTGVSFDVEYTVSLKEYRLAPPKVFFGLVRVGDKVLVRTAVRLETAGRK